MTMASDRCLCEMWYIKISSQRLGYSCPQYTHETADFLTFSTLDNFVVRLYSIRHQKAVRCTSIRLAYANELVRRSTRSDGLRHKHASSSSRDRVLAPRRVGTPGCKLRNSGVAISSRPPKLRVPVTELSKVDPLTLADRYCRSNCVST